MTTTHAPSEIDPALRDAVAQAAQMLMPHIATIEPHVAVLTLLTIAASVAQGTQFTRDHLHGLFLDTYDKTQKTFEALKAAGGVPAAPPSPEEMAERMKRVQEYAKANPNTDPATLMKMLTGQA